MASLAEELRLLSLPAPGKINLDEFQDDLTSARVISRDDIYEDESESKALGKSSLRNKAAILLADQEKRYAGEAISRKDLLKLRGDLVQDEDLSQEHLSDDVSGSEYESDQELLAIIDDNYKFSESSNDKSGNEDFEQDNESGENEEIENEAGSYEVEEPEGWDEVEEQEEEEMNEGEEMQKFSHSETDEVQKGKAVVHQIALWDNLLENRIRLQKMLVEVNKLPQHDVFDEIKERGGNQIKDMFNNTEHLLIKFLHNLLILQQILYERNSDTAGILNKENKEKVESDEDIPSSDEQNDASREEENDMDRKQDGQDILKLPRKRKQGMHSDDYSEHISKRHTAFEHFRDTTIKKWNEKTRLSSGKVSSKSFSSFDKSTLNQIKQILADKERLIKRTQLKRSSYRVLGKMEDDENKNLEQRDGHLKDYDTEIFDDDDFYHQLLREFIERKSNVDPNDPIAMGRQWLEIQRLRNKVKRKVDTKASKGRRLRFDVHAKLVSFMAPQNKGTMPDSSRNELFSSLFGKRQPLESADITLFR